MRVPFLAFMAMAIAPSTVLAQVAAPDEPEVVRSGVTTEVIASGLEHPWSLAFLPDGQGMLVTEREGSLRLVVPGKVMSPPIAGVPAVFARGQGGLLDVVLAPDFTQSRRVYLSYAEAGESGYAGTAVGYGQLSGDHTRLEDFRVIYRQQPKASRGNHFGARLVFDRQGKLFITLGDNNERPLAQDLGKHQGKVVRLNADGSVPADNPFTDSSGKRTPVWSYGHRNPQGAALNPWTGRLWVNEHGPRGGDEINIVAAGQNYGWPLATYGINYTGFAISEAKGTHVPGTQQPAYYWKVSPAISGMAFYDHPRFAAWQQSVFIGGLRSATLIRVPLDKNGQFGREQRLLTELGERIRDVRSGPDGYLYVLTDASRGRLLKIGLQ